MINEELTVVIAESIADCTMTEPPQWRVVAEKLQADIDLAGYVVSSGPMRDWLLRKYAEALEEDLADNRDLLEELAELIFPGEELAR